MAFQNNGGTFSNITSYAGIGIVELVHGSALADVDGDGDLDLLVAGVKTGAHVTMPFFRGGPFEPPLAPGGQTPLLDYEEFASWLSLVSSKSIDSADVSSALNNNTSPGDFVENHGLDITLADLQVTLDLVTQKFSLPLAKSSDAYGGNHRIIIIPHIFSINPDFHPGL